MRVTGILTIAGIIGIIVMIIVLQNPELGVPSMQDNLTLEDKMKVNVSTETEDASNIEIEDEILVQINDGG